MGSKRTYIPAIAFVAAAFLPYSSCARSSRPSNGCLIDHATQRYALEPSFFGAPTVFLHKTYTFHHPNLPHPCLGYPLNVSPRVLLHHSVQSPSFCALSSFSNCLDWSLPLFLLQSSPKVFPQSSVLDLFYSISNFLPPSPLCLTPSTVLLYWHSNTPPGAL